MAGGYGHTPQGVEALVAKFRELEKRQDDLRKMLVGLGIQIDGPTGDLLFNGDKGKLRILGTGGEVISGGGGLTIADDGTLTVSGDATFDGDTSIGGNLIVGGTLSLPNGIIDNDALAAPVLPKVGHAQADSFGLTAAGVEKARITFTVPAGFTRALVWAAISANGANTSAAADSLDGYVDINGVNTGWDSACEAQPGTQTSISNFATALLTGLSSTFYVRAILGTIVGSWSSSSLNTVNVDAAVMYLR